jgi:hypothetical protein
MYESNHNEAIIPQVAAFAAQWGADQELEACCAEMLWQEGSSLAAKLRDRHRLRDQIL